MLSRDKGHLLNNCKLTLPTIRITWSQWPTAISKLLEVFEQALPRTLSSILLLLENGLSCRNSDLSTGCQILCLLFNSLIQYKVSVLAPAVNGGREEVPTLRSMFFSR